ncbi:MAG: LamG domain-containing protein, partial [Verrucomicrobia bacterium]|nr:LamG domain-containing protein [Verrucomicrobiota bacterium]
WVKTDSTVAPHTHRLIFGDSGAGVQRNLHLSLDSYNRLSFEWADGKSNDSLLAPASLLNGPWKHVAVVADSRAMRVVMYVDGVEVVRKPMSLPISKAPTKERLTGWFYNGFFQGELDDIRLYNRALTAKEIQRLFASQADVQAGAPTVLFDGSRTEPRGIVSATFRNWSKQQRQIELDGPRKIALKPGAAVEVTLGEVALQPVWQNRNELFICEQRARGAASVVIRGVGHVAERASVQSLPSERWRVQLQVSCDTNRQSKSQPVRRGDAIERMSLGLASQLMLEPMHVHVKDPWQRRMTTGKTARLELDVQLAMPAEQLREGTLRLRLVSRETGREALARQIKSPRSKQSLALDVRALPWGAYELQAGFHDRAGREVVSVKRVATVLPDGKQQVRVLNNFVSELMDARARGLLQSRRIEFMNPRDGWVWFSAAGNCELTLGNDRLTGGEAMRLLPAGRHVLQVSGTPSDLIVRAIPALVYNVYPSSTQIAPFGANTWERLRKHTLPNANMIESHLVDVPEQKEWIAQGKKWLANVQAPGLIDTKEWTEEKLLELWLKPGTSTAHAARPGLELAKVSGMQVDEYYPGAKSTRFMMPLARSLARFAELPEAAGKFWIPFTAGKYGATPDNLLMRTVLG